MESAILDVILLNIAMSYFAMRHYKADVQLAVFRRVKSGNPWKTRRLWYSGIIWVKKEGSLVQTVIMVESMLDLYK